MAKGFKNDTSIVFTKFAASVKSFGQMFLWCALKYNDKHVICFKGFSLTIRLDLCKESTFAVLALPFQELTGMLSVNFSAKS